MMLVYLALAFRTSTHNLRFARFTASDAMLSGVEDEVAWQALHVSALWLGPRVAVAGMQAPADSRGLPVPPYRYTTESRSRAQVLHQPSAFFCFCFFPTRVFSSLPVPHLMRSPEQAAFARFAPFHFAQTAHSLTSRPAASASLQRRAFQHAAFNVRYTSQPPLTWITRMLRPVSCASCSRMWRVGFGVAAKAAFSVSSCFALMVVRGPRRFVPPGWFSSFPTPPPLAPPTEPPLPALPGEPAPSESPVPLWPESLIEELADIGEHLLDSPVGGPPRWLRPPLIWLRPMDELLMSSSSRSSSPRSASEPGGLTMLSSKSASPGEVRQGVMTACDERECALVCGWEAGEKMRRGLEKGSR